MDFTKKEGLELALGVFTRASEGLEKITEASQRFAMVLGSVQGLLDAGVEGVKEELSKENTAHTDAPVWDDVRPFSYDEEDDREKKLEYIKTKMVEILGYAGVWEDETFTRSLTDEDINKAYNFVEQYVAKR